MKLRTPFLVVWVLLSFFDQIACSNAKELAEQVDSRESSYGSIFTYPDSMPSGYDFRPILASVSATQELKTAYSKYENGQYQEAIAAFSRVILGSAKGSQSQRNSALLGRAKLFLVISQPQLSLADLDSIEYPQDALGQRAELDLVKGVAFIQLKNYVEAIEYLTRAERVMKSNAMLLSNRAVAYQSVGRYGLARRDFEASLRLERAEPTLYNLAVLEKLDNKYERCVSVLDELVAEKKTNAAVFQQRGVCLSRLGQAEAAMVDLLKSLAVNQANPVVLEEIAGLVALGGNKNGAKRYLERASSFYLQAGATEDYARIIEKLQKLR